MNFFCIIGKLHSLYNGGGLIFCLGFGDETGIHFGKFISFAGNGFFEILGGRLDHTQIAQMGMSVDGFSFGGGPE